MGTCQSQSKAKHQPRTTQEIRRTQSGPEIVEMVIPTGSYKKPQKELEQEALFARIDADHNQEIKFQEFEPFMDEMAKKTKKATMTMTQKLNLFHEIDRHGDGVISKEDFKLFMRKIS